MTGRRTATISGNTLAAGDFDNRPRYLAMHFIMRVK